MARSVREPASAGQPPETAEPISARLAAAAAAADGRTAPAAPPSGAPAAAPPGAPEGTPAEDAAAATASVPDVPRLADGVALSGDMEESAFVEPQWLVQRDGQFVQLTELLYRVVEQIDGTKSLVEIAEAVGDAIDRDVTDDNVRQLIAEKLMPLGLVPNAAGQAVKPAGGRSLLQVNAKMAMIPAHVAHGLGKAFSFFYWPPVLIVALAAAIAAQAWLYVAHGIGGSVHDVLYQPQLLLVVLAVIVVATGFHELGHAAALVYGGGRVRGMGAGFYLIYPAFYTDVTDNYRLGRWARVRTDLGGIYFNLIFAAAIIGLYLLTGWQFLLVSVILLNIQTVQQLLPFVRLDGYWLLADITGIPDFFTHMGGFLRSIVPVKAWRGPKLPELKWWGKAVFAGYVLLVIPILAFMVFVAIRSFPRLAATTWDSFRQQLGQVSSAFAAGDVLGVLGTSAGIVLLALPALGLAYMFWALGKGLAVKLWQWSAGDVRKRVLAMAAMGATVLALAVLWTPYIPVVGRPGPLYADWTPITRDERGTLADVVPLGGAWASPAAAPTATGSPLPTFAPAAGELAASTATAAPSTPGAAATATPGTAAGSTPADAAMAERVGATATATAERIATTEPTRSASTPTGEGAPTSAGGGIAASPTAPAAPAATAARGDATPTPIEAAGGGAPPPTATPWPTATTAPAAASAGSTGSTPTPAPASASAPTATAASGATPGAAGTTSPTPTPTGTTTALARSAAATGTPTR